MGTHHAATELADGPKPEVAAHAKQPEHSVPAELDAPPAEASNGQPADPGAAQAGTEADAPSGGVCASGQLSSTSPSADTDQFTVCKQSPMPRLRHTVCSKMAHATESQLMTTTVFVQV